MARTTLASNFLVRVVPASRADIHRRSAGAITRNPIALELMMRGGTFVPERGGFYCEALFGPLWSPAANRFAHFDLAEPIPHPYWPCTIDTIAVAPATLRATTIDRDGMLTMPELTVLYQRLYASTRRLQRLIELGAPAAVLDTDRELVSGDVAALFDNPFAPDPVVRIDRTRLDGLASLLAGEELEVVLFALGLQLVRAP